MSRHPKQLSKPAISETGEELSPGPVVELCSVLEADSSIDPSLLVIDNTGVTAGFPVFAPPPAGDASREREVCKAL